jgi:hypothetical protein
MSNKNPFEIRQEVLQMAKDYMDQQYHMNVEFTRQMVEQNQKTASELLQAMTPYTTEELMKKASEFYAFVAPQNPTDRQPLYEGKTKGQKPL